jgi:8-oxo-dGTP pyrophosphatase MutT (NUDIX family)
MGYPDDAGQHTWDGKPVASVPPFGATVVVYRMVEGRGLEILMLHRAHLSEDEGDWAWTPPSGARSPDEDIMACAQRELEEEAGLRLPVTLTTCGTSDWYVFLVRATEADPVQLRDREHDRYEWLSPYEALRRCTPAEAHDPLCRAIHQLQGQR